MARSRFVKPDNVRLELSGGDWILVKKRLNAGEQREVFANMVIKMVPGERPEINPRQAGLATILEYLIDWSFVDDEGKPVVIRDQPRDYVAGALLQLEHDDFNEIFEAITTHEAKMTAEREQEKKTPSGATVM